MLALLGQFWFIFAMATLGVVIIAVGIVMDIHESKLERRRQLWRPLK